MNKPEKFVVVVIAAAIFSGTAQAESSDQKSAADSRALPAEVTKMSLTTLRKIDSYFPMPGYYELNTRDWKVAPDQAWYRQTNYPVGQSSGNWQERMTFGAFPKNFPLVELATQGLKKNCQEGYAVEKVNPPEFNSPQAQTESVIATCDKFSNDAPYSVLSYHVLIVGSEYGYVLSREWQMQDSEKLKNLRTSGFETWRRLFAKFTICEENKYCVKEK